MVFCISYSYTRLTSLLNIVCGTSYSRYIYGSEKEFKDASVAVEVYEFAHEMQLDSLVADAGRYLHDVGPDNLIPVYNLFTLTANKQGLENCRMVSSDFY